MKISKRSVGKIKLGMNVEEFYKAVSCSELPRSTVETLFAGDAIAGLDVSKERIFNVAEPLWKGQADSTTVTCGFYKNKLYKIALQYTRPLELAWKEMAARYIDELGEPTERESRLFKGVVRYCWQDEKTWVEIARDPLGFVVFYTDTSVFAQL